tara:strand:- start:276 stop:1175 length:900 start_codon:yes stop_codon:yes gene_type:complete
LFNFIKLQFLNDAQCKKNIMGAAASVDDSVTVDCEIAKVLNMSDGNLAKAANNLNRDINRIIPKTPGGNLDATSIKDEERESVYEVLDSAKRLAEYGYNMSWGYYKKTIDDKSLSRTDKFLLETKKLADDFPDVQPPPRCDLPDGASIEQLASLAYFKGDKLLKPLEIIIQEAGGEYKRGPRKKERRIKEKMEEYDGDFARVVDLERATGVFDSVDDMSQAISLLRNASHRGEITIRRCKDRFGNPCSNGYRDVQMNIELDGFIGELQLNLRKIIDVKKEAHIVYEVERVLKNDRKENN